MSVTKKRKMTRSSRQPTQISLLPFMLHCTFHFPQRMHTKLAGLVALALISLALAQFPENATITNGMFYDTDGNSVQVGFVVAVSSRSCC